MTDSSRRTGYDGDESHPDVQQKFGYAVWVWTIGSAVLIAIGIIALVLSLAGFWSNDFVAPPV